MLGRSMDENENRPDCLVGPVFPGVWKLPTSTFMKQDEKKGKPPWVQWPILIILLIGVAGACFVALHVPDPLRPEHGDGSVAKDLFDASEAPLPDLTQSLPNPGYLGANACAPCHAKRVEEFLLTNHAHAIRRPDTALMPSGFKEGKNRIATSDPDFHFEMAHEGDAFYQKAWSRLGDGKWNIEAKKIDFVYGWGRLDEVNFSWENDRLFELPAAWIYPMEAWGLASTYQPHISPSGTREATPNCLECHTTWFSHYPGTPNRYQPDSFLLGVSCERCHGPGKEHVAFHEAHPQEKTAKAIVQPGKLSRERQIEVCTQCHSNAIREKGPVFSYRPGEPLDQSYRTIHPKNPEDDHVANQITTLRQSKCFQKSETLSCASCHDPHRPHEPPKPGAVSSSCAQCHQPEACKERPKLPLGVRNDCTGCHMPPRVWMNVNFHIEEDKFVPPIRRYEHRIGIHPEATKTVLLRFDESHKPEEKTKEIQDLKRDLIEHWLKEAKARRSSYRILGAIGAVREGLRIEPKHQELKSLLSNYIQEQSTLNRDSARADQKIKEGDREGAKELLEKVLALKPNHALAHGKLGVIYRSLRQRDLAEKELLSVAKFDPDEAYGYAFLGWFASEDGRLEEAIRYYRLADEIQPYVAKNQYDTGIAYLQLQRWPEAAAAFEKAVQIDPQHAGARQGWSHALARLKRPAESLIQARLATKLTAGTNPDVVLTLVEAYLDNGDLHRAKSWAQKGLDVLHQARAAYRDAAQQAQDASLEARLRGRLKRLQSTQ